MAALTTLTFLALTGASSGQFSDCSYYNLLDHLNLTSSNTLLEVMRPVKNWTEPTLVKLDMVVYGILGLAAEATGPGETPRPPSTQRHPPAPPGGPQGVERRVLGLSWGLLPVGLRKHPDQIPKSPSDLIQTSRAQDEKSQTVTSHIWMSKYWTNYFLTWNSSDFCGIDELFLPSSMLWIPDVIIVEDASDSGSIAEDPWVALRPNGLIVAFARQLLTFTCHFNLFKFPFDVQKCNITFLSMGADVKSLILESAQNDSALTELSEQYMITQGEWDLKDITIVSTNLTNEDKCQSALVFMVTLERRPLLYVINFILPLVYLLVLDLGTFFISESGGEKLNFKVTILLSISLLLLILKDILPSTEVNLPIIAKLCVSVFTLVWLGVLETMLVSFLIHLDDVCGKKTDRSVDADVSTKQEANVHKESPAVEENGHVKPEKNRPRDADLLKAILDEVKSAQQKTGSQKKETTQPGFCRKLAKVINILCFVLYFLTVFILVTYIFIVWVEH